jgi:hypothetical protein
MQHHPMADPRIETLLAPFQFTDDRLDLGRPRRSSHGEFIYNLHLVAVHEQRFAEVDVAESPLDVGLSYLNNLAYAHGMRPRYQFGYYVGTFGPYDMNAVRRHL